MTSCTPAARAAAPRRRVAGPGTTTDCSSSRRYQAASSPGRTSSTQAGQAGRNASGNTTSRAPSAAAFSISPSAFWRLPSRSRNTGAAWTAATLTLDSVMGFSLSLRGRGLVDDGLEVVLAHDQGVGVGDVEAPGHLDHVGLEGGGLVGAQGGEGLAGGSVEGGEVLRLVLGRRPG